MLVTFRCKAYHDVLMFGDVAVRFLEMMGRTHEVPCAIESDEVPEALRLLQLAVDDLKQHESEAPLEHEHSHNAGELYADFKQEPQVSLAKRALPLIELLEAAKKAECFVSWK
jgi:hypothetical protein